MSQLVHASRLTPPGWVTVTVSRDAGRALWKAELGEKLLEWETDEYLDPDCLYWIFSILFREFKAEIAAIDAVTQRLSPQPTK
jgi:hypothetical protein